MAPKREQWGSRIDFILSAMGYAIGLGNVWRFPYLAYENGGGAFLLPYLIMLFVIVLPLVFMEVCFGQFGSLGCISSWRIAPIFKGIGYGMVILSALFCLYYNIIIAYALYYMCASCQSTLPWVGCNQTWNTDECWEPPSKTKPVDGVTLEPSPSPTPTLDPNVTRVYASEEYWKYKVLDMSAGLHDLGDFKWDVLVCFIVVWIVVYLCIIKGSQNVRKVVYVTVTFPYLVLVILFFVGIFQPGAVDGILYFITPDFAKLKSSRVWLAAANQVFFSYGVAWGTHHTLSSYNRFHNDSYRDVFIILTAGALTSIFAGFVIFSILGFMSYDIGLPIDKVVDAGLGLAFVAYPEAISRIPVVPQLWSFLFFLMLISLGLDSQFVTVETVITAFTDEFVDRVPWLRTKKPLTILAVCVLMFCAGLTFTTQGGIYIMTLFDWYCTGYSAMFFGFLEIIVISYIYGLNRFTKEIKIMVGHTPGIIWKLMWGLVTPGVILFIFIYSLVDYTGAYVMDYVFPPWAEGVGWALVLMSVVPFFVYFIYYLCSLDGPLTMRLKTAITPLPEWGPARNKNRIEAGYAPIPGWGKIKQKDEFWHKRPRDETVDGHINKGFYDVELAQIEGSTSSKGENDVATE
ncbi:sodium- and chloride-dependent glycine transporter 1-like [Amphiura filiformis]|uniref:sodium- and chloride-dependent glycine transporter 1-like n=1 Tax=Amphiura filiformis TaxID=82378 RepID=UPI003B20F698